MLKQEEIQTNTHSPESVKKEETGELSAVLETARKTIEQTFHSELNTDFCTRTIYLKGIEQPAVLFYINGIANNEVIEKYILTPLAETTVLFKEENLLHEVAKNILTAKKIEYLHTYEQITKALVNGNSVLVINNFHQALSLDTVEYEHRSVSKPIAENVIRGSQEAFIESAQTNCALIRKRIKNPALVTEIITIGKETPVNVYVLYLKNITNDELIQEVKKRITTIQAENIEGLELLEQYIEDKPYSLIPTVLYTERPDRAVSFLYEGQVVMLMDESPASLIAPATFWTFFHTSEDHSLKWAFGNFIRIIRLLALFIALLTPSLYISITNFHSAMIPTDLLLAMAATRETVPFPTFIEILMMEVTFELLREAGVRIPSPMGSTIGIVGALILGQAAVDANIISPILVIIVSITGLASFTIPSVSLSFMIRITRFFLLFLASISGFLGVTFGLMICVAYLTTVTSFGVPFLSPMAPHFSSSRDTLLRPIIQKEYIRSLSFRPKKIQKNPNNKGGG